MPLNKYIKNGNEFDISEFNKLFPNQEAIISNEIGQSIMTSLSEKDIEGHNSILIENHDTKSLVIRFDCFNCKSNFLKNRIEEHNNWEKEYDELEIRL